MSTETTAKPYAICKHDGCAADLPTPADVKKHTAETMAPTGATTGITARSHAYEVVNPSPEEEAERAAQSVVGRAIQEAQERAFEEIDREIDAGRVTKEAVTKELRHYPDFADGWAEWRDDEDEPEDDAAANEADDQQFLPWRDDNPRHRPIWRDETRMWECTCHKHSAYRLRYVREHADRMTAKEATS